MFGSDERTERPPGLPDGTLKPPRGFRLVVLLCGALDCFAAGTCYLYGVMQPAIMGYFGIDSALASTPFTLSWMFMVVGEFLASPLQKRLGAKVTATIGLLLLGVGYFACSLLEPAMVAQLVFLYSVVFGIGLGITYNTVAAVSVRWFPDHRGAASSVSLGMMGAAGVALSPVLGSWLETAGLQASLRYLGLIIVPCIVFTVAVFKDAPAGYLSDYKPDGVVGSQTTGRETTGLLDLVKTRDAWLLALLYFSLVPTYLIVNSVFVSFGMESRHLDYEAAVWFMSAAAIAQIVGRFTVPSLSDRIGRRAAFFGVHAVMAVAVAMILLADGVGYAIAYCALSFAYGGGVTSMPAIISDRLGTANAALNIAFAEIGTLLGSVASTALVNSLATSPSMLTSGAGSLVLGVVVLISIYSARRA